MGWRLNILFDNGEEELVDDVFESEEDAMAEYDSWLENWVAGREALKLAGRDYCEEDIEDCEIWEEED